MARPNRSLSGVLALCGAALLMSALPGCGKSPGAKITERLWVSKLPKSPKETVTAFVISDVKERKLGTFYRGSVYRGAHEMFRWTGDDGVGKMRLLQDGAEHKIKTESCKPSKGFDHCILVHGDPMGVVRYESRKRWALRKKGDAAPDVEQLMVELSDEDEDLGALFTDLQE